MSQIGKLVERTIEKIFMTMAYKSVGREIPPEIKKAMSNGTLFKVGVTGSVLTASVNGIPVDHIR